MLLTRRITRTRCHQHSPQRCAGDILGDACNNVANLFALPDGHQAGLRLGRWGLRRYDWSQICHERHNSLHRSGCRRVREDLSAGREWPAATVRYRPPGGDRRSQHEPGRPAQATASVGALRFRWVLLVSRQISLSKTVIAEVKRAFLSLR